MFILLLKNSALNIKVDLFYISQSLILQNEVNVLTRPGNNVGYSEWYPNFPYSLQDYNDNIHVTVHVVADPDEKKQGMMNYGASSTAWPICENRN